MADNKETNIYNNKEIRIVMVGKTGAGKSATGNTILGQKCFETDFSSESVTEQCSKAYGEVDGQKVSVIDTPGLFDTNTDKKTTRENITQCMSYASPGPHIFLIVIKLGRFTEEEKKTVEKIQKIFGEEANTFSMVLFTHGDQLRGKSIEELEGKSKDLPELVAKCNGQYHVFNNYLSDGSQTRELLNKIRKITEKNTRNHYTTEMFQKAERAIEEEKQRILKEKEEQMRKEREEVERKLKEKYEQKLKEVKENAKKEKERILKEREDQMRKEKEEEKEKRDTELKQVEEKAQKEKEALQKELEEGKKALKKEQEEKARREAEKSNRVLKKIAVGIWAVAGAGLATVAAVAAGAVGTVGAVGTALVLAPVAIGGAVVGGVAAAVILD